MPRDELKREKGSKEKIKAEEGEAIKGAENVRKEDVQGSSRSIKRSEKEAIWVSKGGGELRRGVMQKQ